MDWVWLSHMRRHLALGPYVMTSTQIFSVRPSHSVDKYKFYFSVGTCGELYFWDCPFDANHAVLLHILERVLNFCNGGIAPFQPHPPPPPPPPSPYTIQ